MDTLDFTFYSVEPGCVTIYNASKVLVHFLGHVTMPKISSLMFEQRHVFDSGTLYNNEHKDYLVRKAGKTISDIPTVSPLTRHNYSQWIMKLLGLLKPWEDSQTESSIHYLYSKWTLLPIPIKLTTLKMLFI